MVAGSCLGAAASRGDQLNLPVRNPGLKELLEKKKAINRESPNPSQRIAAELSLLGCGQAGLWGSKN